MGGQNSLISNFSITLSDQLNRQIKLLDPVPTGDRNLVDSSTDGLSTQIDSLNRLTIAPSPTQIGTHTFTLVARQGNLVTTQDITVNVIPGPITDTRISGTILGTNGTVLAGVVVAVGNTTATTNREHPTFYLAIAN